MATRPCFLCRQDAPFFEEVSIDFEFHSGFSVQQKRRSIASMHEAIKEKYPDRHVLEISTKSPNPAGIALSAFNLQIFHEESRRTVMLENAFQASKVFEGGGPYLDLLFVEPKQAKRDPRLKASGQLSHFSYGGQDWETTPPSMFYDWLYIAALNRNDQLSEAVLSFDAFTDIEFNPKKMINCQARSAAIFTSLTRSGRLNRYLESQDSFRLIYTDDDRPYVQLSFADLNPR